MSAKKTKSAKHSHKTKRGEHKTHKGHSSKKKHETPVERTPSFIKENMWQVFLVIAAVVAIVIFISFKEAGTASEKPSDIKTSESGESAASGAGEGGSVEGTPSATELKGKVKVDFYVMSQCPFGTQVEDAFAPVLKKMGDAVDFNLNFIANDLGDGSFQSLHGQNEVEGNIYQLCVQEHYPDKLIDFVTCMNKDARSIPGNWESCAEENGIDKDKIKACFDGEEGKQLLAESIKASDAVQARGSPTMYFNDKLYNGGRDALSFQREICRYVPDHEECKALPACGSDADCTAQPDKIGKCENPNEKDAECVYTDPVAFEVIVINDKTCKSCDTSRITSITEQLFKGAKHRYLDVADDEAKKLIEDLGLTLVPAYIFDSKVTGTYTWKNNPRIQGAFVKAGDYYRLSDKATGASRYISEEARQKYYDSIGLTPGDNRPQVDFFVMSYCPFGNQAETILEPVYQQLKEKADFIPRYVIYSNYRGGGPNYCIDEDSELCSMHGIVELHQDIREKCVYKHMGIDKWFEFALAMNEKCNSQNADECWEGVADELGLDKDKIEKCAEEEGEELIREDKKIGDMLGVSGSPTLFFEGEKYGGARSVEGYMSALCSNFDDMPEECDTVPEMSDSAAASAAAAPSGGACG